MARDDVWWLWDGACHQSHLLRYIDSLGLLHLFCDNHLYRYSCWKCLCKTCKLMVLLLLVRFYIVIWIHNCNLAHVETCDNFVTTLLRHCHYNMPKLGCWKICNKNISQNKIKISELTSVFGHDLGVVNIMSSIFI